MRVHRQTWKNVFGLGVVRMYPSVLLLDDALEHDIRDGILFSRTGPSFSRLAVTTKNPSSVNKPNAYRPTPLLAINTFFYVYSRLC